MKKDVFENETDKTSVRMGDRLKEDDFLGVVEEEAQRPFKEEVIEPEPGAEPETKTAQKSAKGFMLAVVFVVGIFVLGLLGMIYLIRGNGQKEIAVGKNTSVSQTLGAEKNEYQKANDILQSNTNTPLSQPSPSILANTSVNDPNLPPPLIYQPEKQAPVTETNVSSNNVSTGSGNSEKRIKSKTEDSPESASEDSKEPKNGNASKNDNSQNFVERKTPNVGGMIATSEKVNQAVKNNQPVFKKISLEEARKKNEPPFSSVIPIRLLGSLHSLNSKGYARLETTRATSFSNGFFLPAQTQFVGRIEGSADKRLFISIQGYINEAGNLVPLSGDVLATDAALGLKGKKYQLNSRFKTVFSKVIQTASELGQAYLLGRNGGNGGYIREGISPIYSEAIQPQNNTSFVVIESGEQGYIFVNDLPPSGKNPNLDQNVALPTVLNEQQIRELTQ